jgi:hypothetical protein
VTRLHALVAEQMREEWADLEPDVAAALVRVGIETDRGSWVGALVAAGSSRSGMRSFGTLKRAPCRGTVRPDVATAVSGRLHRR